jgi:DNA modification methylase
MSGTTTTAAKRKRKATAVPSAVSAAADTSPAQRQYLALKEKHPDYVLLFRMGDFYEAFFEDANTLAAVCGVTLTTRTAAGAVGASPIPMAGVPFHAVDGYLRKLIAAGHKTAIAEQTAEAKGPSREVVRVVDGGELVAATPAVIPDRPLTTLHGVVPGVFNEAVNEYFAIYHGDSCETIKGVPDDSVGLGIHSPPFSNLYIYSDNVRDMGNAVDDDEFFGHYAYLIPQLWRVTKPGRLCVVHCKDLPRYRNRDGAMGLKDFPGRLVAEFERHGWVFHSRVTIWKDPVTEMQRTKNHGLLYKELCKDSTGSRQGMADYLLTFRKWPAGALELAERAEIPSFPDPVTVGGERFDAYVGYDPPDAGAIAELGGVAAPGRQGGRWPKHNPFPPGSEAYRFWSIHVWQRYASPVWWDIDQMNVLNDFRKARTEADEKHICPLQLDVIARCVALWSNPGDVVYSPFGGIGSEPYVATRMGRRGLACELKESYWRQAVRNCERAVRERQEEASSLFGAWAGPGVVE